MSDTMRAAFEAWDCQEFCIDVEHYKQVNGVYVDAPIRNRWLTWQAAQSQPAPPVSSSVQEIMRLIQPYVAACLKFNYTPMELIEQAEADVNEAFKPIEAALIALAEENRRLKFELDGVNAMRRPLTQDRLKSLWEEVGQGWLARGTNPYLEYGRAIERMHGIEPEQGEEK